MKADDDLSICINFTVFSFAMEYNKQKRLCHKRSSMARSLPVENLLPQNVWSIINYLKLSTEAAQWGTPSCSQPQPAMDNGVREGRSNWLVAPPPSWAVHPERLVHSINQCNLSGDRTCNRSMRGNHLAYAATQGISGCNVTSCVLNHHLWLSKFKIFVNFLIYRKRF